MPLSIMEKVGNQAPPKQRDQYVPETVNLPRPALQDLKAQVRQMKPEDQTMLKAPDSDMLLNMVMS